MDHVDLGDADRSAEDKERDASAKKLKSSSQPKSNPPAGNVGSGPAPMQCAIAVTPLGNGRPCPPSAQRHFETAVDCSYTWANDLFFTIVLLGCRLPINVVVDLPILLANSWFSLRFYHGIYLLFNPRCLTELVLVLFSGSVWLLWWMNHGRRSLHLVCCNSSWRTWRPRRSTYDFCLLFQLDLVINLVSNLINPCNNPFQCSPNLFSLCVS